MTDENHDRAISFVNGDGVTLAVIVRDARSDDFTTGLGACPQHGRKANERTQEAQRLGAINRRSASHRSVLVRIRAAAFQSMMKPKLPW
jgi:hypothetical protein